MLSHHWELERELERVSERRDGVLSSGASSSEEEKDASLGAELRASSRAVCRALRDSPRAFSVLQRSASQRQDTDVEFPSGNFERVDLRRRSEFRRRARVRFPGNCCDPIVTT